MRQRLCDFPLLYKQLHVRLACQSHDAFLPLQTTKIVAHGMTLSCHNAACCHGVSAVGIDRHEIARVSTNRSEEGGPGVAGHRKEARQGHLRPAMPTAEPYSFRVSFVPVFSFDKYLLSSVQRLSAGL